MGSIHRLWNRRSCRILAGDLPVPHGAHLRVHLCRQFLQFHPAGQRRDPDDRLSGRHAQRNRNPDRVHPLGERPQRGDGCAGVCQRKPANPHDALHLIGHNDHVHDGPQQWHEQRDCVGNQHGRGGSKDGRTVSTGHGIGVSKHYRRLPSNSDQLCNEGKRLRSDVQRGRRHEHDRFQCKGTRGGCGERRSIVHRRISEGLGSI